MNAITNDFLPYFEKIKMLVGVTKQKKDAKKIQYSIGRFNIRMQLYYFAKIGKKVH